LLNARAITWAEESVVSFSTPRRIWWLVDAISAEGDVDVVAALLLLMDQDLLLSLQGLLVNILLLLLLPLRAVKQLLPNANALEALIIWFALPRVTAPHWQASRLWLRRQCALPLGFGVIFAEGFGVDVVVALLLLLGHHGFWATVILFALLLLLRVWQVAVQLRHW